MRTTNPDTILKNLAKTRGLSLAACKKNILAAYAAAHTPALGKPLTILNMSEQVYDLIKFRADKYGTTQSWVVETLIYAHAGDITPAYRPASGHRSLTVKISAPCDLLLQNLKERTGLHKTAIANQAGEIAAKLCT